MSKQDFLKMPSWVFKVNIHCDGCKNKVRKILQKIDGVYSITIDAEQGKVTVLGNVDPLTLLNGLEKGGKHAELWGGQKVTNNMLNNLHLFQNMQMPNNGKANKSQKGGKDQHKNVKKMKGHKDLNLPQKPVKFNMPLNDDAFYDDSEFDDDDGEFEDESFDGHHHHKNSVNIKMKPFMCNGHGTHGSNKGGYGEKGGLKVKGKSGGKNDAKNHKGGKEKGMFKFTSSFRGLLRKFEKKKCCSESKKGRCDGGKASNKGGTIKNVGKNGGKDSGGLKGGVKKNKNGGLKGGVKNNGRGKKKGCSNGGGDGAGGHSLGSWDHMINNEAINESSFNKSRKGHNGGSGGRNVGHMDPMGDYPMNLMGRDHLGHSNLMGQMGNGNVMNQMGLEQMGQMRNNNQRGQMGIDHMGHLGNSVQRGQMGQNMMGQMDANPMGQMGNIPAVHGLPAGALPSGGYQNMGQGWNQYNQQQQQYLAAMMNQQQALQGSGMYQPTMQGRPQAAAMSYGPAMPPPVTINITEYFSDENPNNCSIM
ncbi:Heavy metal-associated isoprenylated plant protein 32 [Heracleum sosnowskyi]|uniref:Heavy metal-associated isoprenylated plant protein 32 n=1 Tax=Heracleum sosnowskyi TaxID=360622 RepID=A0AAD8MF77_9APIA|nr:Heavy metal-associated isoprenylated plant protein 32 [Heracleum sosnowskyi]